jgi:hypothetical protein
MNHNIIQKKKCFAMTLKQANNIEFAPVQYTQLAMQMKGEMVQRTENSDI